VHVVAHDPGAIVRDEHEIGLHDERVSFVEHDVERRQQDLAETVTADMPIERMRERSHGGHVSRRRGPPCAAHRIRSPSVARFRPCARSRPLSSDFARLPPETLHVSHGDDVILLQERNKETRGELQDL
jgi:hypothetical protein